MISEHLIAILLSSLALLLFVLMVVKQMRQDRAQPRRCADSFDDTLLARNTEKKAQTYDASALEGTVVAPEKLPRY